MTTLQVLIDGAIGAVEEWCEEHNGDERTQGVDEIVASYVPVMTSSLFQLAVDDNSLAFEDIEREHDTPFSALQEAVEHRIRSAVDERLRSLDDDG